MYKIEGFGCFVVFLVIVIIAASYAMFLGIQYLTKEDEYESKELCEENLSRNEFCHNVWVKKK